MSGPLTVREKRLINAALSAFTTAIVVNEVDNGVTPHPTCGTVAEETYDDLGRYFAALSRVAPGARPYAKARFERMLRGVARDLEGR